MPTNLWGVSLSAYFGLVPRQYQSGETDRNGRITKRGNPLARTTLVECAWASLRYNPWAKGVYERISGKQKTRKKKAAVALAPKIAVIAWAMLRDEKDWEPKRMIEVSESFGRMPKALKESLSDMKPISAEADDAERHAKLKRLRNKMLRAHLQVRRLSLNSSLRVNPLRPKPPNNGKPESQYLLPDA